MKSLTRTIIVLVVFNLVTGSFAMAQAEGQSGPAAVEPATPALSPMETRTFTISGRTGIGGVVMDGLPGNPVSDERGYYSATVKHGWSGTVRPTKEGYAFEPTNRPYSKVTHDQANQNYTANLKTCKITGIVSIRGIGIEGVVLTAEPGEIIDTTDEKGVYTIEVPYNWSGTITLYKEGFAFDPPNIGVFKVTRDCSILISKSPRKVGPAPMLGRTGGRKVLVIPDTEVKSEELDAITQDLLVMSHIFDERFKEPSMIKGVFTDFGDFFGRDRRDTEAIYLQGYGTLFLMEVNFAFSPPPRAQEKESKKTEEDVDPTWQRAKQQIFAPKVPMPGMPGMPGFSEQGPGLVKFDQLKTELIKTLKHASNIRNLKADEWVILTVIGQSQQPGGMSKYGFFRSTAPKTGTFTPSRRPSSGGGLGMYGGMTGETSTSRRRSSGVGGGMYGGMGGYGGGMMGGMAYGEMASPSATVLTIRAKKSDVDDFAKGELDFEEFQQKVQIFTY